jgi:hypothetical protein
MNEKLMSCRSRTNFDLMIERDGERVCINKSANDELTWCGWVINTNTLEVCIRDNIVFVLAFMMFCRKIQPSFERLLERPLSSSVNVGFKQVSIVAFYMT